MEFTPTLPAPAEPILDHALLIAGVAVTQASTRTAMLAERMERERAEPGFADSLQALVQVFTGEDAAAAAQLQGSFHPGIAGAAAGKARSSFMKPGFTLAF
jgi:hypothetical protein